MRKQNDLGARQRHHYYFKNGSLDFLAGCLLGYAQQGGMSPGELYHCFNQINEHEPASWVQSFNTMLAYQQAQAQYYEQQGEQRAAAARWMAASVAARAAMHILDPRSITARAITSALEQAFQQALTCGNIPLQAWNIPFGENYLPSYVSPNLEETATLFVVIGGGDTYREDLWFFGGKAALEHGYALLMVDLPGQGSTPYQGMHFGPGTLAALNTALQAVVTRGFKGSMILCGWSGGGYFVTKYMQQLDSTQSHQIKAWIASTPVYDMAELMRVAMPSLLRTNPSGWWQQQLTQLAGRMNPVLAAALCKYNWQFGPAGLAAALTTFEHLAKVDIQELHTPMLALVGLSESLEGRRQAQVVYEAVSRRQPCSALLNFPAESGADAHCQVNNLPLACQHIFGWLGRLGLKPPASSRGITTESGC